MRYLFLTTKVISVYISLFLISFLHLSNAENYQEFSDAIINSIKQIRTDPSTYKGTVQGSNTALIQWLGTLTPIKDIKQIQGLNHLAAYIVNRQKGKNWNSVSLSFPSNLYQFVLGFQTPYNIKAWAGNGSTQGRKFLDASLNADSSPDFYRNSQHTSFGVFCGCLLDFKIFCVAVFSNGIVGHSGASPTLNYIQDTVPYTAATCPQFTLPSITWKRPDNVLDCLPNRSATYLKLAEDSFVAENHARLYPHQWVDYLNKQQLPFFRSLKFYPYDGTSIIKTVEGAAAVTDALQDMVVQKSLHPYQWDPVLAMMAKQHVINQGPTGDTGHNTPTTFQSRAKKYFKNFQKVGENIAYGIYTGVEQIAGLIIDDDHFQNDGHRYAIYDKQQTHVGVACGCHKTFKVMCVFNFGRKVVPQDQYANKVYEANNLLTGRDGGQTCGSFTVTYQEYTNPPSATPPKCRDQKSKDLPQFVEDQKDGNNIKRELAVSGATYEIIALILTAFVMIL